MVPMGHTRPRNIHSGFVQVVRDSMRRRIVQLIPSDSRIRLLFGLRRLQQELRDLALLAFDRLGPREV